MQNGSYSEIKKNAVEKITLNLFEDKLNPLIDFNTNIGKKNGDEKIANVTTTLLWVVLNINSFRQNYSKRRKRRRKKQRLFNKK